MGTIINRTFALECLMQNGNCNNNNNNNKGRSYMYCILLYSFKSSTHDKKRHLTTLRPLSVRRGHMQRYSVTAVSSLSVCVCFLPIDKGLRVVEKPPLSCVKFLKW